MVNLKRVDEALLDLGYPENLTGTAYLRTALRVYHPGQSVVKELYPAIARAHDTTPTRVERAIRHATASAWERNGDAATRYFGNTVHPQRGAPTNGELIARLEYVARED